MPLPAPDWSHPAVHYPPQALQAGSPDYDEHDRDTSHHAHNVPADPSDLGPFIAHIAAHPADRGAPGWVAHRHS